MLECYTKDQQADSEDTTITPKLEMHPTTPSQAPYSSPTDQPTQSMQDYVVPTTSAQVDLPLDLPLYLTHIVLRHPEGVQLIEKNLANLQPELERPDRGEQMNWWLLLVAIARNIIQ